MREVLLKLGEPRILWPLLLILLIAAPFAFYPVFLMKLLCFAGGSRIVTASPRGRSGLPDACMGG